MFLLNQYKLNKNTDESLNAILSSVLDDLSLPQDYAIILIFDSNIPTMFAGISKEIYISEGMLKDMSSDYIRLFIIHELFHKVLDHPYQLMSDLSVRVGAINPTINDLFRYALFSYIGYKQPGVNLYDLSNSLKAAQDKDFIERPPNPSTEIINQQVIGYLYPDEVEWEVDDKVVEFMKSNEEDIYLYIKALESLSRTTFMKTKIKDNKLEYRISRLKSM